MSGTYNENLDETDDQPDSFEVEGIQAFNRLAGAVQGLQSRLTDLELGLERKASQAERAAAKAEEAAQAARTAAEHARGVAHAKARSAASWAVLGALASVLVAGGAGYWHGHAGGRKTGQAEGYRAAVNANAAASWANTPSGKRALALDQAGDLNMLITCSGQGWASATQNGRKVCYPHPTSDKKVHGWFMP